VRIGIPTEVKPREGRVALVPAAVAEVVGAGHSVLIQSGAGQGTGYDDASYDRVGATIVPDAAALYGGAEMILKVKEPVAGEYPLLHSGHLLFCFLHLAAVPELARALVDTRLRAIAWETVAEGGRLPILAPMSEIAGRLATQIGTTLLQSPNGGRGVMLGGVPSTDRGHVVVLGAGNVGLNAAGVAAAMGARVTVLSRGRDSLVRAQALGPNVTALPPYPHLLAEALRDADLFVGAVLVPGAKAPKSVTAEMVRGMRPGSVIVDVAIDQGGSVETMRPTTYDDPTFVVDGVIHFGVTNMPGAVPRTSSQALSGVLVPYVLRLAADPDLNDPVLRDAANVLDGEIVHPAVREALR
jgi:alanine dehydrogenase